MIRKYFIVINGQPHGPFDEQQLKKENITAETLIWHDSLVDWLKARDIPELEKILIRLPPEVRIYNNPTDNTSPVHTEHLLSKQKLTTLKIEMTKLFKEGVVPFILPTVIQCGFVCLLVIIGSTIYALVNWRFSIIKLASYLFISCVVWIFLQICIFFPIELLSAYSGNRYNGIYTSKSELNERFVMFKNTLCFLKVFFEYLIYWVVVYILRK